MKISDRRIGIHLRHRALRIERHRALQLIPQGGVTPREPHRLRGTLEDEVRVAGGAATGLVGCGEVAESVEDRSREALEGAVVEDQE
jgi:hypothetical protein